MGEKEIKPCPFCRGACEVSAAMIGPRHSRIGDTEFSVECDECHYESRTFVDDRDKAIAAHNELAEAVAFREEAPVILRQLYDAAGVVCGENGKELVRIAIAELGLDLPETRTR